MSSSTTESKRNNQEESRRQKRVETMSVSNIVDLPDDVLRNIILYLNTRERVRVGNSCQRFNTLVFEDEELLRDLDFSEQVGPTLETDIQQYFNNENTRRHLRRLNIKNVECLKPGYLFDTSIGKALNLVDLNIHGMKFKDIWQLGSLLNPLTHLQRLSFNWAEAKESNIPLCCKVLKNPFSRLTYLSVEMEILNLLKVFIPSLRLCEELRELHMVVKQYQRTTYSDIWSGEPKVLRNLKTLEYCGPCATLIKKRFANMLPDARIWVDFQLSSLHVTEGFYLENLEVCEELRDCGWPDGVPYVTPQGRFNLGWLMFPEVLLKEVIRVTHPDVPDEFCCLSTFTEGKRCLLKINEAKRLLENSTYQISYLNLNHPVEIGCDVHLVASAFSNLTELVLSAVTRNLESVPKDTHFDRRLRSESCPVLDEDNKSLNMDSSFKMLVENTPNMRHFTLGDGNSCGNWDLDALYLIPTWKRLESLSLRSIPIEDGHFLIEIGKQCKSLQKLELIRLGLRNVCCYKEKLLIMLKHCKSLRNFSIDADEIGNLCEVFTSLANNVQLRKVCMKKGSLQGYMAEFFRSSIEKLLNQCSYLATIVCENDLQCDSLKRGTSLDSHILTRELGRPNLQIQLIWHKKYDLEYDPIV